MKIAVISDIHANSIALDAVYEDLEKNNCEKILVLGDLVGYYYEPSLVVDKIKSDSRCIVIQGNHEQLLFKTLDDEEFRKKVRLKYGSGINVAAEELSDEQLKWLKDLPENKDIELCGVKIGLHHGSEKFTNEYVYPDAKPRRLNKIETNNDILLFGHTHYPVIFPRKDKIIVNPGSVGQPRDVGALASYAIVDLDNLSVVFRRVPFIPKQLIKESLEIDPHYPYLSEILERNNPYAKYYN